MPRYDLLIKNGTIVDGTGLPRYFGDVAISNGIIERLGGDIPASSAREVIDASGQIVAPGVVDPHTHYDAQIHWDPFCTNSGWHGTTTVAVGNCGFGFMPCKPGDRDRYMQMMENTEQVPLQAMRQALPWKWESFPDWMNFMRSVRKGVNIAAYMPLNSLMIYVMGYDAAKSRNANKSERARMRDLLNEAMDAGAIGFGFSHLNEFNSHKDVGGSPMPTDSMDPEDAYLLADVLRERDQGVIQCLAELPIYVSNRHVVEELARRSGRTVLHNVVSPFDGLPEYHEGILKWLDTCEQRGLNIYTQSLVMRSWNEFNAVDADTLWQGAPPFDEFSKHAGAEAKKALLAKPEFRAHARSVYKPELMMGSGGPVETLILLKALSASYSRHEGRLLGEIAAELKVQPIDLIFDIIAASDDAMATFKTTMATSHDINKITEVLSHKRVLPGTSDGGAHVKFYNGGHYSTDNIMQVVRDEQRMTLEALHQKLSYMPARVLGLHERGALLEGFAADIYIYDLARLNYNQDAYEVLHDLPGGDWRRVVRAEGISWNIVNGQVIFKNSQSAGNYPGRLLSNGGRQLDRQLHTGFSVAAE